MALKFNGTSDYVDLGNDNALNPTSTAVTLCGWAYFDAVAADQFIIARDDNALGRSFAFGLSTVGGAHCDIQVQGSNQGGFGPTTALSAGQWYHLAATGNNTGGLWTIYLNGVFGSIGSGSSVLAAATGSTTIGKRTYSGFNNWLGGKIAHVAMYNTALDATEIALLAGGVLPSAIKSSNLIGYWPLDGARSEADLSQKNHIGKLLGPRPFNDPPYIIPFPKYVLPGLPAEGEMPALQNPVVLVSNAPPSFGKKTGVLQAYSNGLSLGGSPRGRPKIDWSQAPRGLKTFFLNNSPAFPELVLGLANSLNGTPQQTMTIGGPAFNPTAGTSSAIGAPVTAPTQCSMEVLVYYGTGGNNEAYCRLTNGAPNNGTFDRSLEFTSGNLPYFYIFDGGAQTVTGTAVTVGRVVHLVAVANGSSIKIYQNGVLTGTAAVANGGYTGYSAATFWQGYGMSNAAFGNPVTPHNPILHCAFADQAWTADEVAQRFADPYAFLVPAESEMPALSAAAPVQFSGTQTGSKQRGVLRAFSQGLDNLHLRQVPRGPPRIDWSHPLANGLVAAYVPGVSLGDLCQSGLDLTIVAGTTFDSGVLGPSTKSTSGNAGALYSSPIASSASPLRNWSELTLFFSGEGNGTFSVDGPRLISIQYALVSASPFAVAEIVSSGPGVNVGMGWNHGGTYTIGSGNTVSVPTSGPFSIGATFAVSGNNTLYKNGVAPFASEAFGAGSPTSTATSVACAAGYAGSFSGNVKTNAAYFYNRALSAAEMAWLDADPYCFLVPAEGEMPALFSGAPAVPTGTLNTTEAKDVAAFNATFAITGTLATTEAQDVAAFNATFAVTGTLNTTEAQDVAAFNATFAITGTLNTTEAQDVAAFNAAFAITGTLVTTEGQDTASFTGSGVTVSGPLAVTEAPDTAAFTGNFVVSGTLATTEAKDIAAFTGSFIVVTGTLATTEAQDTVAFTGAISGIPSGVLATTEAPDVVSISGVIVQAPSSGYLAATEAQDIVYIVGPGLVPLDPVGVLNFGRRVVINRW